MLQKPSSSSSPSSFFCVGHAWCNPKVEHVYYSVPDLFVEVGDELWLSTVFVWSIVLLGERMTCARCKLVRPKWLDDRRKNGLSLVAQQITWAKRDDVTQNTPPLLVFLSAKRHRLDTRLVRRHDVWLVGVAVLLSITHRLTRTLLSFRRKSCARLESCGNFDGP